MLANKRNVRICPVARSSVDQSNELPSSPGQLGESTKKQGWKLGYSEGFHDE